jgi:aminoglycoside phosphotransferase (APT) family kinase protein
MPDELDIEQSDQLLSYLQRTGRLSPGVAADFESLSGGVSNRTVLVRLADGRRWVLKQALARLRVTEEWFSDPARVGREALGLRWLQALAPAGTVPAFLWEDPERHLLAMAAVPEPHENWKARLLLGDLQLTHVEEFARWLGWVHRRSQERRDELSALFADRSFFQSLRLDPYYRVAAARNAGVAAFLETLICDTHATRLCLVHGDYSPKNVLLHGGKLVVLDHEVIHFGDPAFDLGFALTHLLSKANHLPAHRRPFLEAAIVFWKVYCAEAGELAGGALLEQRGVRHTLACLLARVDGRSPLEYLAPPARDRQRQIVLRLIASPPRSMAELIDSFHVLLEGPT